MKQPVQVNALRRFAPSTDPNIRIDPSPATADKNTLRGMPPANPADNEQSLAKGGKVKRTGPVKAHQGEHVIKRASAQKYGGRKMAAVNAGTAKVTTAKRR